ncbi:hypothetical protein KCU81_g2085, partial [Aureobasidium melanogenum]
MSAHLSLLRTQQQPLLVVSALKMSFFHNDTSDVEMDQQWEYDYPDMAAALFDNDGISSGHLSNRLPPSPIYLSHEPIHFVEQTMPSTSSNSQPLMAVTPALECLRSCNTALRTAYQLPKTDTTEGPMYTEDSMNKSSSISVPLTPVERSDTVHQIEEQSASLPSPEDGYDPYGAHILSQMSDIAQSPNDADAPLPVRSRTRAKIPGVRATCEACRKLKVKCLPAHDDGPCQKCTKKGERCIRMPRAAYGSRTKRR